MKVYHIEVLPKGFGSWNVTVEVEVDGNYVTYKSVVTDSEIIDGHREGDSQELINFVTSYSYE